VIGGSFAGVELAGLDREPAQLAFAQRHLAALGLDVELRQGDAAALPWPDASFDHVFIMWLLEHLSEPHGVLREALRVLAPGCDLVVIETDYTTFRTFPESEDFAYLARAQHDLFALRGNPIVGRQLGTALTTCGFQRVRCAPWGFHFFQGDDADTLRAHAEYVAGFLEPQIAQMVDCLGRERELLEHGLAFLRGLIDKPEAALTQTVYRASARRPE